ncbi:MAG: hypothetical protein WEB09_05940 [Nitriliruptor sp.]
MSLTVTPRADHRTDVRRIDALIGGPVWWATHLGLTYWLVPRACEWQATWPLHLVTIVTVALCGRAWLSAVQVLRGARLADPAQDPTARRDIYLGWIGILLAIFFGAVTLYEGIPAVILNPCF